MENMCNYGSGCCWTTCAGLALAWWLVASGLLFVTWNRVIGSIAKVKPMKYWHALVLLLTLVVLLAPRAYMMKRMGHCHGHASCAHHGQCPEMNHHCKGHCPHSGEHGEEIPAVSEKK